MARVPMTPWRPPRASARALLDVPVRARHDVRVTLRAKPDLVGRLCALLFLSTVALLVSSEASASRSGPAVRGPGAFEGVHAGASRHAASLRPLRLEFAPSALAVPGNDASFALVANGTFAGDVGLDDAGPLSVDAPELASGALAEVLDAQRGTKLVVTEPRRGPPARGPETRIGAFEVPGASLIGAETFSNPHAQRGQRVSWLEIAEGEHPAVWVHNGRWVKLPPGVKPARGTIAGNVWRWQRYKLNNGTLGYQAWLSASRGGRGGGAKHAALVQKVVDDIRARNLVPDVEVAIGTVNGARPFRAMDVVAIDPITGRILEVHQVGKSLKSKPLVPISRERKALRDVRLSPTLRHARRFFHSYGH